MCNDTNGVPKSSGLDRRGFLKVPVAAMAAGVVGGGLCSVACAEALTREQRDALTPAQILDMMRKGNERFRSGQGSARNYITEQKATAKGQYPAAVFLSCIDSRAPAEVIMDLGIGDIFNSRIAGNVTSQDVLGGMEFACAVSGAKVVMVMGHTACGAIKGAIDNVQMGNLTGLLAKIQPAVAATSYAGDRSSKNPEFVDAVALTNVKLMMDQVRQGSPILRDMEMAGTVDIAGAMYDLATGKVEIFT
jgi:carbonic anhydrase